MSDLISRQDIYDLLDNWDEPMVSISAFWCDVEDLPSAEPKRKKGKWILSKNEMFALCSECGCHWESGIVKNYMRFCPSCGSDNRGEEE